jgi:hypothetical protein
MMRLISMTTAAGAAAVAAVAAAAGGAWQAIGFVRASGAPEDQLERVVGRKGLMRCAVYWVADLENGLQLHFGLVYAHGSVCFIATEAY